MKILKIKFILIFCYVLAVGSHSQDWNTLDSRKTWLIEQFRGASLNGGAKFGTVAAVARLRLNPNDTAALGYLTRLYDNPLRNMTDEFFTYPSEALALGEYWDHFTADQRAHLLEKLKGLTDLTGHGTENHALMRNASGYLFAQYWPNEMGWLGGTYTSARLKDTTEKHLLASLSSLFDKGFTENLSTTYEMVHLFIITMLYERATDIKMKKVAEAAFCFHALNIAANSFQGLILAPYNRENIQQFNTRTSTNSIVVSTNLAWLFWLYWHETSNLQPQSNDIISKLENRYVVFPALCSWNPPAIINAIAQGAGTPYTLHSCSPGFGYWGTGTPAECIRSVYRTSNYALGTGVFRYNPDEYYINYNGFGLIYASTDMYNYLECFQNYWRSDDTTTQWPLGINSPLMETGHYRNSAIALFNIPTRDPWTTRGRSDWIPLRDGHSDRLLTQAKIRYPKSMDQVLEMNGWIFLREGNVFMGVYPLKPYTIDSGTGLDPRAKGFNLIKTNGSKLGFVFDVAAAPEFISFAAFQQALLASPPAVDTQTLTVRYQNCRGDSLEVSWRQPDYAGPKPVIVQPDFRVNGVAQILDTSWPILASPNAEVKNRILKAQSGNERLTVDWRGDIPVIAQGTNTRIAAVRTFIPGPALGEIIPNPFNPGAEIHYHLGQGEKGVMTIYSAAGQEVLDTEVRGTGRLFWNATNLSSGIYFCALKTGKIMTTKMAIIQR